MIKVTTLLFVALLFGGIMLYSAQNGWAPSWVDVLPLLLIVFCGGYVLIRFLQPLVGFILRYILRPSS